MKNLFVLHFKKAWIACLSLNVQAVPMLICIAINVDPLRLSLKVRRVNQLIKYGKPNEFVSDPGDRYKPEFRSEVLKNGEIVLKESGKVDLWQMINSEKEHCDMAYILKQLAHGNYDAFDAHPLYGDYSEMPNDYREVLNIMVNVESDFLRLPLDVRAKYDNDFHKWLADAGTDEWKRATWPDIFGKEEVVEKEVVEKESAE